MEFQVGLTDIPFSLEYTLTSGQVFRWVNRGEWWYGVANAGVLKIRQEGETLRCSSSSDQLDSAFVRAYLGLEHDLEGVYSSFGGDATLARAIQKFYGLRLMRQDPWECLGSFVLATNSNIPSIARMVSNVCSAFGEPLNFEGATYSSFPSAERIASASLAELEDCRLGYRAPYIKKVAECVDQGRVDFSELLLLDYSRARESLLSRLFGEKLLLGVGPKVADCVLLFSLEKFEAFPIDVWLSRALSRYYPDLLGEKLQRKLSSARKVAIGTGDYEKTSESARRRFGEYAGYAQQYLYMLVRDELASG
jgi:N-glycosylase/DNA lyase